MTFAIIDAVAGGEARACRCAPRSRYSTPIANLPLIYHVFDELAAAGIDRVEVIVSPNAREELEQVLGGARPWGVEVSYTTAAERDGRSVALAELERVLADEPVLVYPGDCLFPGRVSAMWERFREGHVDAVVLSSGKSAERRGRIAVAQSLSCVSSAPAIIGSSAASVIDELHSPGVDHLDLSDVLRSSECRVGVCERGSHWRYSDETEDLLIANRMMLDALPAPPVDGSFGDNVVHGRVAISSSARVSGCILHGPVAVDDNAVIEDSFIGPFTAIGAEAILVGAEIDNAMVLAGAEINHPGHRIEASIIGERASVVRSFALPRGLHLRLEPHSRVALS